MEMKKDKDEKGPYEPGNDTIDENERRVLLGGHSEVDLQLKTQIETLVLKWSQHINEVLRQDSSKALQGGNFPTPICELSFWEERVQDLQCIYDQINEDRVRKMAVILEQTGSTSWPCFKTMFRNVVAALAEAQDILVHLKPFKKHLDMVSSANFDDLERLLRPMMHCVCLIWGYSRYYCSAARIIVLLQEISNLLIKMARSYLGGSSVFQMEPEEGLVKTSMVVDVLQYFRDLYDEHRSKLPVYFDETSDPKDWDFSPHLVFKRYDKFLDRMKSLKNFFDTSVEFYKLERCDIGGGKGRNLSAKIQEVYEEFIEFYQKFAVITYDCSDPEDDSFEKDNTKFLEKVDDVDQRVSSIVCKAMDDCHTPESCYKLIMVLGSLLDRPVIKADFEPKYSSYVSMIEKDIDHIKELFDEQLVAFEDPEERKMIDFMKPPYARSVYWAKSMRDRAAEYVEQFKSLELAIEDEEDTQVMLKKEGILQNVLREFQDNTFDEWAIKMKIEAESYLLENIINRQDSQSIYINFSVELSMALKDVRYMQKAGYENIPQEALNLYEKRDVFRKNLINLDQIARWYNKVHSSSNPVEGTLLENKILQIDKILEKGETQLRWSDSGEIWTFINSLQDLVKSIEVNLQKAQDNVKIIQKLVARWITHPLFERKDCKKEHFLSLDDYAMEKKEKRYKDILVTSTKLKGLIAKNKELLYDDSTTPAMWNEYLTYLDGFVTEGLIKTISVSYGYLVHHTDSSLTPSPLMEVRLELIESELIFEPALDFTQPNSFLNLVEDLLADISHQAVLIDRIKMNGGPHYLSEIEINDDLSDMRAEVEKRVQQVMNQAFEYTMRFEPYAYLWEDDRLDYLNQFLKYGHQLSAEEIEAKAGGKEPIANPSTFAQLKEAIDKFENIYLEVETFEQEIVFEKWFKLNMVPFRISLLNLVKKWSLMFKNYLIDSVIGGLSNLEAFINEKALNHTLQEGDITTLIYVTDVLHQVKKRQVNTHDMFGSIKEYIKLLKSYDFEMPEPVSVQLEELPQKWNNTSKLVIQVKHQVALLQAHDVKRRRSHRSTSNSNANSTNQNRNEGQEHDMNPSQQSLVSHVNDDSRDGYDGSGSRSHLGNRP